MALGIEIAARHGKERRSSFVATKSTIMLHLVDRPQLPYETNVNERKSSSGVQKTTHAPGVAINHRLHLRQR